MNRNSVMMGFSALAVAAGCASEMPPAMDDESLDDDGARGSGYFLLRHDTRTCDGTSCGGYWVSPVNGGTARCADGTARGRCYVAAMDLDALGLSDEAEAALARDAVTPDDAPRIIVRGSIAPAAAHTDGVFVAREVWRASNPVALSGAVVHVAAAGEALTLSRLNSPVSEQITDLDTADSGLSPEVCAEARRASRAPQGILAVGLRAFGSDAQGGATPTFHTTQVFHRVMDDDDVVPVRSAMLPPPLATP